MAALIDAAYLAGAAATAPIWLTSMIRTGKIHTDWNARLGHGATLPRTTRPRILLHAVSVGEVNATRLLVERLAEDPARPEVIIATTTDTGFAHASRIFEPKVRVIRYPFDVSWAVKRVLDRVRPDVVGLLELEVWPNFLAQCRQRGIPVAVLNGRLSPRSHRRYRKIRPMLHRLFARLDVVAAQDEVYADRFRDLGVPPAHLQVTGNMKWDTARIADSVDGADQLAEAMGIDRTRPLVVAGSTAPEEHALLHEAVGPHAQLLCAPRKPEWFERAATDLPGCGRRSRGTAGGESGRFLLDTIGELRAAYALADVVVIGRTFVDLGGSDMIEPVALGKATVVGPDCANFKDALTRLLDGNGLVQATHEDLAGVLSGLLGDPARRTDLAERGRAVIRAAQGATERNATLLTGLLGSPPPTDAGESTARSESACASPGLS